MKYAVVEHERRWRLDEVPAGVRDPRRITDRYLDGTRLRLRLVESPDGEVLQRKLGHKRRVDPGDPSAAMYTSLYLDVSEWQTLSELPGRGLAKTRWLLDVGEWLAAVDAYEDGLILLEIDFGSESAMRSFQPPPWLTEEVTADEAFTGGRLAGRR